MELPWIIRKKIKQRKSELGRLFFDRVPQELLNEAYCQAVFLDHKEQTFEALGRPIPTFQGHTDYEDAGELPPELTDSDMEARIQCDLDC